MITGWWFQIFFIFTPTWGRFPIWLIYYLSSKAILNRLCLDDIGPLHMCLHMCLYICARISCVKWIICIIICYICMIICLIICYICMIICYFKCYQSNHMSTNVDTYVQTYVSFRNIYLDIYVPQLAKHATHFLYRFVVVQSHCACMADSPVLCHCHRPRFRYNLSKTSMIQRFVVKLSKIRNRKL